MFEALSREHRLLLLEFVCAFAWADLRVTESERAFVRRLVEKMDLDAADRQQVEVWLGMAPAPSTIDATLVPKEHRRIFVDTIRALVYADGEVDLEERENLEALKKALEL